MELYRYPRTHHIEGSRRQPGDEDLESVRLAEIAGRYLVIEEKMDGGNAAISFDPAGRLLLQSRGHYLTGGPRERHFDLFKAWAACHAAALRQALGRRYVLYGEWLYAKHTIFYDSLPHYFLEFDVLDKEQGCFLSTPRRAGLLAGLPIVPVRVLWQGEAESLDGLAGLVGPSLFIRTGHLDRLRSLCRERGLHEDVALRETDQSMDMEGLYIKVEENGIVQERYKYVRASFLSTVLDSGSHWLNRPIVPNLLQSGVDLYAPAEIRP